MAAVTAAVSLAACGSEDANSGPKAPPSTSRLAPDPGLQPKDTRLTVKVRTSGKAPQKIWVLNCDPPGGDHPRAAASCAALAKAPDVFKPTPPDQACTMIYGGEAVATVTGTWRGQPIDSKFSRLNGCEINRWDKAGALLGKLPPIG